MKSKFYLSLILLAFASAGLRAQTLKEIPELKTRVVDQTGTLNESERSTLEERLMRAETEQGIQIFILIVDDTAPEAIEAYSIRVAEAWKPGQKKKDDGVLFLISKNNHTARIEVGYGLEGAIPDVVAKRILDEQVFPSFKEEKYFNGIDAGVTSILERILAEQSAEPPQEATVSTQRVSDKVLIITYLCILVGGYILRFILDAILGDLLGHFVGGLSGGVIAFGFSLYALGEGFLSAVYVGGAFFLAIALGLSLLWIILSIATGGKVNISGGGGSFGGGGASSRW
ncbi:MAG: TPM domain-containing protein [Spirochaetia bacterium]|nr:TPM domain-containing protein [Spirochaetia bacterium]